MTEDIKDKDGSGVTGKQGASGAESASEAAEEAAREKEKAFNREAAGKSDPRLPKIDFATFIFSLNSAVLVHLGIVEDPVVGKPAKDLPLAKQTIDLLGMLEEKTRGNLNPDEENMLKNILYDLRIRYVRENN